MEVPQVAVLDAVADGLHVTLRDADEQDILLIVQIHLGAVVRNGRILAYLGIQFFVQKRKSGMDEKC